MAMRERPTPALWPGYACGRSREQWDADQRRHGAQHDQAVKTRLGEARIELKAAMASENEKDINASLALVEALKTGQLPGRGTGRAPIRNPGGSTGGIGMDRFWSND